VELPLSGLVSSIRWNSHNRNADLVDEVFESHLLREEDLPAGNVECLGHPDSQMETRSMRLPRRMSGPTCCMRLHQLLRACPAVVALAMGCVGNGSISTTPGEAEADHGFSTVHEITPMIRSLEPWHITRSDEICAEVDPGSPRGGSRYSDESSIRVVLLAMRLQKTEPRMVKAALREYQKECYEKRLGFEGETKAMLLLRVMFDIPVESDIGSDGTVVESILGLPMKWTNRGPEHTVSTGFDMEGPYAADREYQYCRRHFRFRTDLAQCLAEVRRTSRATEQDKPSSRPAAAGKNTRHPCGPSKARGE
jgi:hypothetical protein